MQSTNITVLGVSMALVPLHTSDCHEWDMAPVANCSYTLKSHGSNNTSDTIENSFISYTGFAYTA